MPSLESQVAALERLTAAQLRKKYLEVFGEPTNANNKAWLVKRVAWRVQVLAEGGLSERARARAQELARDADLRLTPPRSEAIPSPAAVVAATLPADPRLPPVGSVLTRTYKNREVRVIVRADGFEYDGRLFHSLSAAAHAVTGSHLNGFAFFKLAGGKR